MHIHTHTYVNTHAYMVNDFSSSSFPAFFSRLLMHAHEVGIFWSNINMSYHKLEHVMLSEWMNHSTRMEESWNTYAKVMTHVWMSLVTRVNVSGHAYEWVMSRIWISNFTHVNKSCHAYEWVMLQHARDTQKRAEGAMTCTVCCSVVQGVEVCCTPVFCSVLQHTPGTGSEHGRDDDICSVLQCVAVCCSVSQCVAVYRNLACCSASQCVAACAQRIERWWTWSWHVLWVAVSCSALQCVAVYRNPACCSALRRVAVRCSALRRVAARCGALQSVAACAQNTDRVQTGWRHAQGVAVRYSVCIASFEKLLQCTHCIPEIHQIEKLDFLGILRNKSKFRFWFNLKLYRGIRISRFGGFRGCSIFSGNCRILQSRIRAIALHPSRNCNTHLRNCNISKFSHCHVTYINWWVMFPYE